MMRNWGELACVPGVRTGPGLGLVGRGEMTRYSSEADSHGMPSYTHTDGGRGYPSPSRTRREDLDEVRRLACFAGWCAGSVNRGIWRGQIWCVGRYTADLHRVSGCK